MAIERTIHLMGTIIKINIQTVLPNEEQVADEAVRRLRRYEKVFSANDDASDLMKINHLAGREAVSVPRELFDLIKIGKKYSMDPNGYLNIAIGPLVKLWHIGFQDAHVPSNDQIKQALPLTDPEKIILNDKDHSVMLANPGMEIDLGALAKGYSADLIKKYLVHSRVQSAVLNLGGNVVVIGGNKLHRDGCWHVGLQDPKQAIGHYVKVLPLENQSIVTSGIYERNLKSNGQFYHHIFDPATGYPIETDMASLSIISPQSVDGEIWTSMLFGKPWTQIAQIIHAMPNIQAIGIYQDGQIVTCE